MSKLPVEHGSIVRIRDVEGVVVSIAEHRHGGRPPTWTVIIATTDADGSNGFLSAEVDGIINPCHLRLVA